MSKSFFANLPSAQSSRPYRIIVHDQLVMQLNEKLSLQEGYPFPAFAKASLLK